MLQDACPYGGVTLCSDHQAVVACNCLHFDRRCLMYKKPKKQPPLTHFTPSSLCLMKTHAMLICSLSLNEWISSMPTSLDPNARLEEVLKCVKDAATETIGIAPYRIHRSYTQDPLVAKLSFQQRALRHRIEATGDSKDRTKLRRERGVIF